ncbi:hypothetical protein C8J29_10718 [Cereibacter johrii]|uniref:Uncharacterized protein n=1 Tax=Cereibacter johrii TaxID=445629 RepID=A0ABX5J6U6_9RHOB|nr:hypothetical protein C8J29_10718 [Cereibacter johrii]
MPPPYSPLGPLSPRNTARPRTPDSAGGKARTDILRPSAQRRGNSGRLVRPSPSQGRTAATVVPGDKAAGLTSHARIVRRTPAFTRSSEPTGGPGRQGSGRPDVARADRPTYAGLHPLARTNGRSRPPAHRCPSVIRAGCGGRALSYPHRRGRRRPLPWPPTCLPACLLTSSLSSPPHLLTSSPPHLLTSSPPHLLTSSPPHLLTCEILLFTIAINTISFAQEEATVRVRRRKSPS